MTNKCNTCSGSGIVNDPTSADGLADCDECLRRERSAVEQQTDAARDVLAERARQISSEGWPPEHDDAYTNGELVKAAVCYAWLATVSENLREVFKVGSPPPTWPWAWSTEWWKPTTPRRDLVKAGALILAEIERLDRLALLTQEGR